MGDCFTTLFASLFDTSDLSAPVIDVNEATDTEPGSVFLIWYAPASGYTEATDTFIFDENAKILEQNVVVYYQDPRSTDPNIGSAAEVVPTGSGAVHDAWSNHFAAFGEHNVSRILLDYTEASAVTVYNHVDKSKTVYRGM